MASVRYIILLACQNSGLYAQAGWESEAAAWIEKQGDRPCAYVGYGRGRGIAGFDNVSVVFGGGDPRAALRRVRDSLERSLEFRSERQTEVDGFPVLVMTARAKKRIYGFGGVARPVPPVPPTVDYMYFEAVEANSTVALTSTLTTAPNLEYSTDGETWQDWQHTTADSVHTFDTITLTAIGDRVYLRGDNPNGMAFMTEGAEMPNFSHFVMTGGINAGGNIMSLLDTDVELTEVPRFGLMGLFSILGEGIMAALLTPPSMDSITTIGDSGCEGMYNGCTSLTSAAAMPALTTIGDSGCEGMYNGCTSLTSAAAMPQLTTIGDSGCEGMYGSCTSLTSAAAMQQLTTIGDSGCESMYSLYTSLTSAAAMPQLTTIGDSGCLRIYYYCTFNMSNDGTALNFDFPTPPIMAGETTYPTAYDVAQWMGNTNGFSEP